MSDRYFKEGFTQNGSLTIVENETIHAIQRAISYGKINWTELSRRSGVREGLLRDFFAGTSHISRSDFVKIWKNYSNMRSEVKSLFDALDCKTKIVDSTAESLLNKFLNNRIFYTLQVMEKDRYLYDELKSWINGRRNCPIEVLDRLM